MAKQACARMALTALYNLSFTPGLEIGSDEKALDDKDQLVPGNYDFSVKMHELIFRFLKMEFVFELATFL